MLRFSIPRHVSSAAQATPSGLLADGFPWLLDLTRRKVVQPGAAVVPSAATLYCMGIQALTGRVAGFNMTHMNTFRWGEAGSVEGGSMGGC